MKISRCPNCDSSRLYKSKEVSAGGGYAPNYLPGLGGAFSAAKFEIILCADCGLSRFFAPRKATEKLADSSSWSHI